jgi:hypothetical protein
LSRFQKSEGFIIATGDEPPDHSLSIPSCAFLLIPSEYLYRPSLTAL